MPLTLSRRLRWLAPTAASLLCLVLFWALGEHFLNGYALDLGRTLDPPTPWHGRFLGLWMFFGGLAAGFLALAFVRAAAGSSWLGELADAWRASSDGKWLLYGSLLAGLVPAVVRTWLLHGMPLTDDESAYRFMAETLALGRLYADSPPLKLFFDRPMMINDGKLYAQYFLGWPALMAPGVWLGMAGFMNALCSALTLPALFLVLRRLAGASWAKLGVVLYLGSPMLMVGAATELSHTSCLLALAWTTWLVLRCRDAGARWLHHAGVAGAFSIAFFIRPTSALGVGVPLLLTWVLGLRALPWRERRRALLAFVLPALLLGGLFLGVNQIQTGSPFEVAYQRAFTYAQENGFRFSFWPKDWTGERFSEFTLAGPIRSLAIAASALYRLNFDLLGWPCSLLFAFFAWQARFRSLLWGMVGFYLLSHLATDNVGIDTFAPMHYYELAWPLLLLTGCGLAALHRGLVRLGDYRAAVPAIVVALLTTAAVGYLPVRFGAIHRIAENVRMPWQALEDQEIDRAVVFTPEPFIQYCRSQPTRGWVLARPNNDPRLENDVLWVNHLSLEADRRLMQRFPDRSGWVMIWDPSCRVVLAPLEQIPSGRIPDADVAGLDALEE